MNKLPVSLIFLLILCNPAWALNPEQSGAPQQLQNWTDWVLYGYEESYYCPKQRDKNICVWPVSLEMSLDKEGGRFKMRVENFYEGIIPLPGENGLWPKNVRLSDGKEAPVLKNNTTPVLYLKSGKHTVEGEFEWKKAPETISIPAGFTLKLLVDGSEVSFPVMKEDGIPGYKRLWLKINPDDETDEKSVEADSLDVRINRLIQDGLPMNISTNIKIAVSGKPREATIENATLEGSKTWSLSSPLPAQLDGTSLKLKVKPGVYEVTINSRDLGVGEKIGPSAGKYGDEYWAFMAVPALRQVEVEGAAQIDPSQANIYAPWQKYPIYAMEPGSSLEFNTLRRGDPEPQPDNLNLRRECWLDYNGKGLSCRDNLTGTMNRHWHLNVNKPFDLAQASLDGQPQVITWQTASNGQEAPGLQLRKGRLNLMADLRIEKFAGAIPASGWDQKLDSSQLLLHLSPGYHLFHVSGAEAHNESGYKPASWTGSWGTLDFFIVLIISIAVWKLYGRTFGVLALITLILSYHEPWAPRMIFLHLLGSAALLRILPPKGKARFLASMWRFCAAISLVFICALFLINQAQVSMFPQLENPYHWSDETFSLSDIGLPGASKPSSRAYNYNAMQSPREMGLAYEDDFTQESELQLMTAMPATGSVDAKPKKALPASRSKSADQTLSSVYLSQAPDAKVQNSLARPNWHWRDIKLDYKGAASVDQEAKLYIYGPVIWRILGMLRIILMLWFTLLILEAGRSIKGRFGLESPKLAKLLPQMKNISAVAIILAAIIFPGAAAAQTNDAIPSQQMLDQYRQRLLNIKKIPAPTMPLLELTLQNNVLSLKMSVEAGEQSILMLPSLDRENFQLTTLSLENGSDLPVVEEGAFKRTLIPQGRHNVLMKGKVRNRSFQITFNELIPESVGYQLPDGWQLEGLEENKQLLGSSIMINNTVVEAGHVEDSDDNMAVNSFDPVFEIQRKISFGLEWRVYTSVSRLNPDGRPASINVELLPGENPLSSGFKAENGRLTVHFGPNDSTRIWESSLPISSKLELASEKNRYETWSLDVSPIWRIKYEGIPPIYTQQNGLMQPTWKPWPGEKLTINIDRPQPIPGQYLVIDNSDLLITVGENYRSHTLNFTIRASQGGPYSFKLPEGSELHSLKMNGRDLPTSSNQTKEENIVTLPLSTGEHKVTVYWITEEKISSRIETPDLDMGIPMANISVTIDMDQSRWILWAGGPMQGPVVQFWSLLLVVLLIAFLMSRTRITPLNTAAWFLLGIGLIQYSLAATICVAGWLLILGNRLNRPSIKNPMRFNLWQVALACFTLIALILIYQGIKHGLLQNPDMLIKGHNSYAQRLSWFYDRSSGLWPSAWVLSTSNWFYKGIMLAWSLWMAVSLIKWLRWGWTAFTKDTLWKKSPPKAKPQMKKSFANAVESAAEKQSDENKKPAQNGDVNGR